MAGRLPVVSGKKTELAYCPSDFSILGSASSTLSFTPELSDTSTEIEIHGKAITDMK